MTLNYPQNLTVLTVIIHIYNNQKVLDLQAQFWSGWEQVPNLELIFIDDGSIPPLDLKHIPAWVRKIRILDDIPWNQPGAKNLGASLSSSPWLLFLDADQFLDKNALGELLGRLPKLAKGTIYRFNRYCAKTNRALEIHQNCQLISKLDYENFGGYDEDFSGNYGHEDAYLERLWRLLGGKIEVLDKPHISDLSEMKTMGLNRNDRPNELLRRRKIRYWHCIQNPIGKFILSHPWILKSLIKIKFLADGRPTKKIRFHWIEI